MELAAALADLARDHGTALFRDPSAFRAALDDYLDEGTATSGTINLLTDAVRLGALDGMVTMLDSGATAEAALDSAGQRLARERGSSDTRGCQWACALLGYALGRIPESAVRALDPGTGNVPGNSVPQPSPIWPATPAPPVSSPPATFGSPAPPPPASPSYPPQVSPAAQFQQPLQQPAQAYGAWAPPAPKKSRTGLIVGLAVVALVLVIGGVVTAVALSNGGDDGGGGKKHHTTTALTGPKIDGTGYVMTLPDNEWTDGTDSISDTGGTLDKMALWGQSQSTARANVIVEVSSAEGATDPSDLESQWKAALTNNDATANLTAIPDREIDGLKAIGTDIVRVNSSDVTVHQTAYLVIHGTTEYSIAVSFKDGDSGVEPEFTKILDGWKWS